MRALILAEKDDVAVAMEALAPGEVVALGDTSVEVREPIGAGHKIAVRELGEGALVHKYGQVIGRATCPIRAGAHVHTQNLGMPEGVPGGERGAASANASDVSVPIPERRTFEGYRCPHGGVGTRNYIAVLTSVNCSATVAKQVARRFELPGSGLPEGVDGVVALTHGAGCGMADRGEGWDILRRTLVGYGRHPNIAALVLIGLGCEVNALDSLTDEVLDARDIPLESFTIQGAGGTAAAIEAGVEAVHRLADQVAGAQRETIGVEELVLGLQCGGSDGWSGLTANPALGVASDLLVAAGGTSILGETPEIFGAEHLLAAKAHSPSVADDLYTRIDWWRNYTDSHGTDVDGNPSPGNKAGGITTILEKSLGAVAKAGQSPLREVREYAERPRGRGLVFMDTPGYDPVSVTGMVAGGANIVAFTTGRDPSSAVGPPPR